MIQHFLLIGASVGCNQSNEQQQSPSIQHKSLPDIGSGRQPPPVMLFSFKPH
jgi:hypothetical protein